MDEIDTVQTWKDVLQSLRVSYSSATYGAWFAQTHLVALNTLDDDRLMAEIGCASSYAKTTLESKYHGAVQECLGKVLGKSVGISFVVKQSPPASMADFSSPLFDDSDNSAEFAQKILNARLRPGFTFENFAVSGSNQMANAAAEAVAANPGKAYNPLFIWGGVGVGKTHIMHAVGHRLIEKNLDSKIIVCTGEDFTNDIVEGIKNKTTQSFRDKYRRANALFIDDIQFIAGKDAVQEEFFHTFNAVTAAGGQIILTSDRPPEEIQRLEDRLQSRFVAGLIVDISQPDFELRCAITQIKAQEMNLELPMEFIHAIAAKIDSARKINGVLVRIMSEIKLNNIPLTEELIDSAVNKNGEERPQHSSPDDFISAVCGHYEISKRIITGKTRARIIARPRQVLMFLLRTELGLPLEEVGRMLGGRDHTTVMHAVEKIKTLASNDVQIREDILQIKGAL